MPKIRVTVRGADQVIDYLTSRALNLTGGNRTVKAYIGASDQSAARNIKVAEFNANLGRDPWHIPEKDQKKLAPMMRSGLNSALRTRGSSRNSMVSSLHKIGKHIVGILEDNLLQMEYKTAGARPLTPKYAARKQKDVGFKHPMLLRYGSLLRGIKYRLAKGIS